MIDIFVMLEIAERFKILKPIGRLYGVSFSRCPGWCDRVLVDSQLYRLIEKVLEWCISYICCIENAFTLLVHVWCFAQTGTICTI